MEEFHVTKLNFEVDTPWDLKVYIGRFSPLHVGHEHVALKAFGSAKNVLILIGSVNKPRSPKDPWPYDERREMWMRWRESVKHNLIVDGKGFLVMPVKDDPSDTRWIQNIQQEVTAACHALGLNERKARICLTGSDRDHTTFYLHKFPAWEEDFLPPYQDRAFGAEGELNATKVRAILFDDDETRLARESNHRISRVVFDYLNEFMKKPIFKELKAEHDYYVRYPDQWGQGPWMTVDNVVVQSGHILLIQRDHHPGKGLWALPGGFVDLHERVSDAALRELKEETNIGLTDSTLMLARKAEWLNDDPSRSLRGRVYTYVYLYKLDDSKDLPKVKAASDARTARWVPLSEFEEMEHSMFEDHYQMAKAMLAKI
jgi:bifunctional NMN adenylyltransferase/nudix hydrolase